MAHQKEFVVASPAPLRLDLFLTEELGVSRSSIQKLIKDGAVRVNSKEPKKNGDMVKAGDVIVLSEAEDPLLSTEPVVLPNIPVLADTLDYLVVDKPSGVLVHPTQAGEKDTRAAWLLQKYPEVRGVGDHPLRPGIVHRLDKEASGLLVIAKNQPMFDHLKSQFKARLVEKEYLVLVYEVMINDQGMIDFAIDRGKEGRMVSRAKTDLLDVEKVKKVQKGKAALTEFWVEKRFARFTFLRVRIHTGRTHQIRVHLFAYNHPVVGDPLYQNKKLIKKTEQPLHRLFLHAHKLAFADLSLERKEFQSGLPDTLQNYLDLLQ